MSIEIDRVFNGWILIYESDFEDGVEIQEVFESPETEAKAFRRVLMRIEELIGPIDSRYSKERIDIRIVPGDKA